ncbi:arginase [Methanocella sp. CWC-04]|uniref:Arginase n=1 Tax=Methanooceanicella nereidis TaxID=2052831 RepID=A0AAP2RES8_9EURY|nr:arginase [Methanocella sp. CWC-04]MCD1296019.1 arginase [Methanocella sp. CWC-04]
MSIDKVRIVGVPLDLGANRRGIDMGPDALRNDGLLQNIMELGIEVEDMGNVITPPRPIDPPENIKLRYYREVICACKKVRDFVSESIDDDFLPLVIGGDHSISMGTTAALSKHYDRIGMLWIDAHGDFNTEETTISGNIHGMSFATSVGRGTKNLVGKMGVKTKVVEEKCVLIGARDLDPLEREELKKSKVTVLTMRGIDEVGMCKVMKKALKIACEDVDALHVSFDLDVMDPVYAPGVGTPVQGGITYREAHLAMEMISDCNKLSSLEMVELNPILDKYNITGKLAIDLITSALGKKIL